MYVENKNRLLVRKRPLLLVKAFKPGQLAKAGRMHSKAHGMHRAPVVYTYKLCKESGICSIKAAEASMPHLRILVPGLQDQSVQRIFYAFRNFQRQILQVEGERQMPP